MEINAKYSSAFQLSIDCQMVIASDVEGNLFIETVRFGPYSGV